MKKTYSEKLKDPQWQKKRLEVFNRDEFKCCLCGDSEDTLHVHHKSYEWNKNPWEYDMDNFQTLCLICHEVVEAMKGIPEYEPVAAIKNKYPQITYLNLRGDRSDSPSCVFVFSKLGNEDVYLGGIFTKDTMEKVVKMLSDQV